MALKKHGFSYHALMLTDTVNVFPITVTLEANEGR